MRKTILILGILIPQCVALFGQGVTAGSMFEVTSVKPTPPDRQNQLRMDYCRAGGIFSVGGTPLIWSLAYAYRVKEYQISGAPGWLSAFDSAYDIEGKPAGSVTNGQCRLMVQSLFVDRFKLAAHRDTKERPVYLLVIGKNGTKLREGEGVKLNGAVQIGASGKPQWADGWNMSTLASYLSDFTGRPVVDRTGLPGTYGITLAFSQGDQNDRPGIFTAVQEQLGLKLEPGRAPVEVFVIDHIERPSAN